MKGSFFAKPLEWKVETKGESWAQGEIIHGTLSVTHHGSDPVDLKDSGIALSIADIKKVHARDEAALKIELQQNFVAGMTLQKGQTLELAFAFELPANCAVSDKKSSYFLTYGMGKKEAHLQLNITPRKLFLKVVELMDNFHRFKSKEAKAVKGGVEFKMAPPASSREFANLETLALTQSLQGDQLQLNFEFQVKKLDTASVTTKVIKEKVNLSRTLMPREYSLGKDMINQDGILKSLGDVLSEIKLKDTF